MDAPVIDSSAPLTCVSLCGEPGSASPTKRQTASSPRAVDERAGILMTALAVTRERACPALPAGRAVYVRVDEHAVAVPSTNHPKRHSERPDDLRPALCIPHRYGAMERVSEALIRCLPASGLR